MKTVRMISVVLAAALFVVAFIPVAAAPVAASSTLSASLNAPVQAFVDAAHGLPLLAPMGVALPLIQISTEKSASSSYSCSLVRQTPKDWVQMRSRQSFDAAWTVKNTGAVWYDSETHFAYVGGTQMQTHGDVVSLDQDVSRGKKIKLVVDMIAPKAQGTYSTLWALFSGNQRFCKVTLTVTVVR